LNRGKQDVLAWESRWARWVAAATVLGVILIVVSTPIGSFGGHGEAAVLRESHANQGKVALSSILQGLGVLVLTIPIYYLFRVVRARSTRVRGQLIGLVIIAPIFLAASAGLGIGARNEAATAFVNGEAKPSITASKASEECKSDQEDKSAEDFKNEYTAVKGETVLAACERRKTEDDAASNAVGEASLAPLVSGIGIAGSLGLIASLIYSCLWAIRTGVLTRFWGSFGMAAAVAFVLGPLFIVTMIWMIYFALLVAGILRNRPPAWDAGEAVAWPTPGERMAKEIEPKDPDFDPDEVGPEPGDEPGSSPGGQGGGGPQRRKRKRRN
jgi:hypothetical protein